MTKLYLAHPISGESGDDVFAYYERWVNNLKGTTDFEVLHPMTAKGYLRPEIKYKKSGYGQPISTNKAITRRDAWMVSQADIVLIDLTGARRVSMGCICELAWAWLLRKHTIIVMEEDNIHQHGMVIHQADIIFAKMESAWSYLELLSKGEYE